MNKRWLLLAAFFVTTKMANAGKGDFTITQTVGSSDEDTTIRNPVIMRRRMMGSYKGRIDMEENKGPVYTVQVLRYHKVKEGRKLDITVEGNGIKDTVTIACNKCEKTNIYSDRKKLIMRDSDNHFAILGNKPNVLVIVIKGTCTERIYSANKPAVERKMDKASCSAVKKELENKKALWAFFDSARQLFLTITGKITKFL